jgi:cytidylate kinase
MNINDIPVITIDGPSGTGKGTLAKSLSKALGWFLLDSGALYRVIGYTAQIAGIRFYDIPGICQHTEKLKMYFGEKEEGSVEVIDLSGQRIDITSEIRLEETGLLASKIAVIPELRRILLGRQRAFKKMPGLVADGRDMGTVVFPEATLKVFLAASAWTRSERRYKQLINKGVNVNIDQLIHQQEDRDRRDRDRKASPLMEAQDAWIVQTDTLTADQVLELVLKRVNELGLETG